MSAAGTLIFLGSVTVFLLCFIWGVLKTDPLEKMLIEERKRHRLP